MKLIEYLSRHFFTREQLLAQCGIEPEQLSQWQRDGVMPKASYHLRIQLECTSHFGLHYEEETVEYYAKGYEHWIAVLQVRPDDAPAAFAIRYRQHLSKLALVGITPHDSTLSSDAHIGTEWRHFLEGTYGLCTASGMPEDIAAKEAAIVVIREITGTHPLELDARQRNRLRQAVELLDSASSPFAPHEVARSSRRRYVDDVRRTYRL